MRSTPGVGSTDTRIGAGVGAVSAADPVAGSDAFGRPSDLTLTYESGLELKARSQWAYARIRFFRHKLAVVSLVVLIFLSIVALNLGALLSGAVVTETVFGLDGMGFYFVNQLQLGDPYPVMAWLMVVAILVVVFNLIADITYGILDPRVRYD